MDANIVIAGFMRDSTVRRILTVSFVEFFAPEFLKEELEAHPPALRDRAGLGEGAARELLHLLEGYVTTIPLEALLLHWEEAESAIGRIDPKDVAYVAAALAVPCDGIWSDDPHLAAQKAVECWTTRALVKALGERGLRL